MLTNGHLVVSAGMYYRVGGQYVHSFIVVMMLVTDYHTLLIEMVVDER